MNKRKTFALNMVAQIAVFSCNLIINFFLTPYVLEKLGAEAYGFIGLISNFVNYTSIVTVALNAMAGRFITLAYHQNEDEKAQQYYASVFYANLLMSVMILLFSAFMMANVTAVLNVHEALLPDVRITIFLSVLNTIVTMLSVVFGVAAFIKNKLYLNSVAQMVGAIVRLVVIVALYVLLRAHVWYYALAALASALVTWLIQERTTRRLCPEFVIRPCFFRVGRVLEILKNGVWVSLESFNKLLQTGLDLLISNIFIDGTSTGLFSVAKTVPNVLTQITGVIAVTFQPEQARLYAEGRHQQLLDSFRFTIRFLSVVLTVPLIGFIVFGKDFYTVWLPLRSADEIKLIQHLSVLTVLPLLADVYVNGLYYANVLTQKVKGSVLLTFGFSVASIVTEIVLLKNVDMNPLYIIAGTSSFFMVIRYLLVTPAYAAWVLKLPMFTFFPSLLRSIIVSGILCGGFLLVESFTEIQSWGELVTVCGSCGVAGYAFVVFALLNAQERSALLLMLKNKLRRK